MGDFLSLIRARQHEITAEIATHTAAINALASELSDIASAGRVMARLEGAAESTAALKEVRQTIRPDTATGDQPAKGQVAKSGGVVFLAGAGDAAAGTQAPPVDTNSVSGPEADTEGNNPALMAEVVVPAAASASHSPDGAHEPGDGSQPSPSVGSSDRANVSIGVTAGETAQNPVANAGEEANGAIAAASDDPASREADDADRQQLAASGLTGEAGEVGPETVGASPAQSSTGKTVGPSGSAAPTLKQLIRPVHIEHPDWTARQIAEHIHRPYTSVSAILGQVRKEVRAEAEDEAEPVEPDPPADAPEPAPEPESPPASTPEPAIDTPRVVRPRSGSKFYLVNDRGLYLNRFCAGFTEDRRTAWIGTESQLVGCRKNFTIARDLREVAVARELPPAPINREVA